MQSIESMFDNIYFRAITGCIVFLICMWAFATIVMPQSQITYDRVVNETYAAIGEENISRIYIQDGCIHIYDNNGVLVSAAGRINKNGVEHKFKLTIIPPFFRLTTVDLK